MGMLLLPAGNGAAADPPASIAPFSANYLAEWKGISVGTSDLELKADSRPGHFVYTWVIAARGIFKLAYGHPVTQISWLEQVGEHVRPLKYQGDDGSSSVHFDFDWVSKRAIGRSEKKPVDIPITDGAQDLNSIQIEVMLDLQNVSLPKTFSIIDKDQLKEFNYTQEGTAKIKTAVGELDTIIVASQRPNNTRVLRMWFAPSLGYIPVKAERTRDGNLEFAMHIRSYKR
jgi:hypothetical protein